MLEITQEKIEKLYKINAEMKALEDIASENLRIAQDRFGHRLVELERDGKKVKLTEKQLWQEVWYGLPQASEILKGIHPEVFKTSADQVMKANELQAFILQAFGMDYKALRFSDYIQLMDAMIDFKLTEKKFSHILNNLKKDEAGKK